MDNAQRPKFPSGFQGRTFKNIIRGEQLMNILLTGWWWGNGVVFQKSTLSAFGFSSEVSVMMVSVVSAFYLVVVLLPTKQLRDMAQDIIFSPRGRTEAPWFCFRAKVLLFLPCLTSFLILSLLLLNLLFRARGRPRRIKLFYKQKVGDMSVCVWGVCPWEGPASSCLVSRVSHMLTHLVLKTREADPTILVLIL